MCENSYCFLLFALRVLPLVVVSNSNLVPNIAVTKANFLFKFFYLFYHLTGFCGREEERGSEKEINKKINSVWLMVKIRLLIQVVL